MDPTTIIAAACAHQAMLMQLLAYAGGIMPVASVIAWFSARWQHTPPGTQAILQLFAGNLMHAFVGEPLAPAAAPVGTVPVASTVPQPIALAPIVPPPVVAAPAAASAPTVTAPTPAPAPAPAPAAPITAPAPAVIVQAAPPAPVASPVVVVPLPQPNSPAA